MIFSDWTYGAEHELGDWPLNRSLPEGFGQDRKDVTIVNSNGIAADPKGITYRFGGEINTPPTDRPEGQVDVLRKIKDYYPEAVVNYRSNLHVHVRVPGLKDDLTRLKKVASFTQEWIRQLLPIIEPIPMPTRISFPLEEEHAGAMKRYMRRRRSHHTVLTDQRVARQLMAGTIEEFFNLEVPQSKDGIPLWHCQARAAVNLRQMLETDTIEFRHFPGTLDDDELLTAVEWCRDYLMCALTDRDPVKIFYLDYENRKWPKFPKYVHWMEQRYRATVRDGTIPVDIVHENIRKIEAGEFDDESPCTLPR